ncbi:MAG TPA: CBS and ACT domain-containing protein [Candidatus Deferrimicrobiaceae bacterium]|nr:CBS and ACT domain-containing protein [Candidatus Deferrimicrobiaceae bacterium]
MLVRDIMQAHPVSATLETRLPHLLRLLQRRGFRHVPVLDAGRLVGIVSDRDIKQAMVSAASMTEGRERERLLDELTAGQIMARAVVTIGPMFGVEEAARLMATRKISALPVTEEDRLVGIVTETDVLQLFVRAMGVLEPSSRLDVIVPDQASGVSEVVRVAEETGGRVSSVMTLAMPTGEREVVLRLATINPGPAVKALEARGYVVRDGARGASAPP